MGQTDFWGWAPPPYRKPGKLDWLGPTVEQFQTGQARGRENLERRLQRQDLAAINQPGFQWDAFQPQSRGIGMMMAQQGMPMTPHQQAQIAASMRSNLRAINTGDITSTFDPTTGTITPTEHPSSKVSSVNIDLSPASPSERTAIAETNASIDALNNLKTLYNNVKTKSGPIVGRTSPVLGLVGMTSREQEDFMAATSAFQNAIIKDITGAQMSETEASRIKKQIPLITDPPARWEAKWKQSLKNLEFLQARRKEILRQSGLKVPGSPLGSLVPRGTIGGAISDMTDEELRRIAEGR